MTQANGKSKHGTLIIASGYGEASDPDLGVQWLRWTFQKYNIDTSQIAESGSHVSVDRLR